MIIIYLFVSLILIGINFFKDKGGDDLYRNIICQSSFYTWSFREELYITPCISIDKSTWFNIYIKWLVFELIISLYVQTDEENDAVYSALKEVRSKNES